MSQPIDPANYRAPFLLAISAFVPDAPDAVPVPRLDGPLAIPLGTSLDSPVQVVGLIPQTIVGSPNEIAEFVRRSLTALLTQWLSPPPVLAVDPTPEARQALQDSLANVTPGRCQVLPFPVQYQVLGEAAGTDSPAPDAPGR